MEVSIIGQAICRRCCQGFTQSYSRSQLNLSRESQTAIKYEKTWTTLDQSRNIPSHSRIWMVITFLHTSQIASWRIKTYRTDPISLKPHCDNSHRISPFNLSFLSCHLSSNNVHMTIVRGVVIMLVKSFYYQHPGNVNTSVNICYSRILSLLMTRDNRPLLRPRADQRPEGPTNVYLKHNEVNILL